MDGWISLHRKLMDNPIWVDSNYLKLWVYCLFKASHKEHEQLVGNQMVKLERGQFITGRFSLAKDMNRGVKPLQLVNERTWWRYLKNLEKFQMLSIKSSNSFSVVTIDKYDFYQGGLSETDHQTVQPLSNDCPADVQRLSTNNKGNKGNKEIYTPEFNQFWDLYPAKIGKKKAAESFSKLIKKHKFETIMNGLKAYIEHVESVDWDMSYQHPTTFLNQESFMNEYQQPKQQKTTTQYAVFDPDIIERKVGGL